MFMLSFAALWIAWRHKFSASGILMGLLSIFGGVLFLSPYLFYFSTKASGDVVEFLLGEHAYRARAHLGRSAFTPILYCRRMSHLSFPNLLYSAFLPSKEMLA
jgi:hypothetical protein